jgi:excinuclease ABC subunit B
VPRTIVKKVTDIMEGAREAANDEKSGRGKGRKVAEARVDYGAMPPERLAAHLKKLEQQMYQHARDLEFEEAGRLRDEIRRVREEALVRAG